MRDVGFAERREATAFQNASEREALEDAESKNVTGRERFDAFAGRRGAGSALESDRNMRVDLARQPKVSQPSMLFGLVQNTRATLYGMIGDLLCEPPRVRAVELFLEGLEADRPASQWATAHTLLVRALRTAFDAGAKAEHELLFCDASSPLALAPCARGERGTIETVSPPYQDRIRHLLLLAVNADATARALEDGQTLEAIRAVRHGRELLCGHTGGCLFDFALRLQGSGAPFYSALGAALREALNQDFAVLETQGVRAQRWIALSVHHIHRAGGGVVLESLVRCPQQAGDAVSIDLCSECGRWNGVQYGSKERAPMILCRAASST